MWETSNNLMNCFLIAFSIKIIVLKSTINRHYLKIISRSAKPLRPGSNPGGASKLSPLKTLYLRGFQGFFIIFLFSLIIFLFIP